MTDKVNTPRQIDGPGFTVLIAAKSPLVEEEQEPIVLAMLPTLEELAEESGKHVHLYICEAETVHYPEESIDALQIVLGGLPPGESLMMWADRVDDIRLHPKSGTQVWVTGPANGYGVVVADSSGRRVAQLVGSTIYLCLPVAREHAYLLAGNGVDLFSTTLEMAWAAFTSHEAALLSDPLDKQGFVSFALFGQEDFHTAMQKQLKTIDKELEELNKKIRNLILDRNLTQARMVSYPTVIGDSMEEIEAAWKQLSDHPLVDFLERSPDDKLHVHTKDILVTDDQGAVRHLGRFIIRVAKFSNVAVWSKYLTHPERRVHPHISQFGSLCFGNVTAEINQLLVNGSEAQVAVLVLAWLAEGYEADLADAKLEEWPLVNEVDSTKALDLRTAFCVFQRDAEGIQEEH